MKDKGKIRADFQSHVHGPATGHGVFQDKCDSSEEHVELWSIFCKVSTTPAPKEDHKHDGPVLLSMRVNFFFRSASPKQMINHPIIDITENNNNNNSRTERIQGPPENQQPEPPFNLCFEPIADAPPPPQQPPENPKAHLPNQIENSLSDFFSNFEPPSNRQDSAGNSTTSSICSLPPSPDASPRLAKRKINELKDPDREPPPKNCLETCPIEDFEDSLEFLFSL